MASSYAAPSSRSGATTRRDVTRGGCHQVAVLVHLAEAACGLHLAEERQRRTGRGVAVLEYPLHVLAWQPGAGANEVLHQHAACGGGVTEPESGVHVGHRLIPAEFFLVDEFRQQQRGQGLGVRCGGEERVAIDPLGPA